MPANGSQALPELFDMEEVEQALAGTSFAGHLHHCVSTPSTNTLAVEAARAGALTGIWIADEQTRGRGRGGHSWHSAAGDGLYCSVLFRPELAGVDVLKVSLAAGIAAVKAIDQATGARLLLRWPNDLMDGAANQKKVGGILTESSLRGGGALAYVVVGIGINLNQQGFPSELTHLASSIRMSWCGNQGEIFRREDLLPLLLDELSLQISLIEREAAGLLESEEQIAARFASYSPMVNGMPVHVAEDDGYTGVTDGLDSHGMLRVRLADRSIRIVRHGGVRPL